MCGLSSRAYPLSKDKYSHPDSGAERTPLHALLENHLRHSVRACLTPLGEKHRLLLNILSQTSFNTTTKCLYILKKTCINIIADIQFKKFF